MKGHLMNVRDEAQRALDAYLMRFAHERQGTAGLAAQLADPTQDIFNRKNMRGHITTSALVLDVKCQKVLLIHHNIYNRWLAPGGHYEPGEYVRLPPVMDPSWLWPSAVREVGEETGLQRIAFSPWSGGYCVPLDIDTHRIAANPRKGESVHVHHDWMYLAEADSSLPLKPQLEEVSAAQWVPVAQLLKLDERMQRAYAKLVSLRVAA